MAKVLLFAELLACISFLTFSDPVLRYILHLLLYVISTSFYRYKLGSCNSLEPVYVEENWQYPGGGDVLVVGFIYYFFFPYLGLFFRRTWS